MGALPPTAGWVRLEVPASLVGLSGQSIAGAAGPLRRPRSWDRISTIASVDHGHTTTYSYDAANRLIASQDPIAAAAGTDTQYGYDPEGNLIAMTDALGRVTTYAYDTRIAGRR